MKNLFATIVMFVATVVVAQGPPPQGNAKPGVPGSIVYQAIWEKGKGQLWIDWPPPNFNGTWNVEYHNGSAWINGEKNYQTFAAADAQAKSLSASNPKLSLRVFGFCIQ